MGILSSIHSSALARPTNHVAVGAGVRWLTKGRKNLDCDVSPQPGIPRPVNLSHPASAERREDLLGTEASPGCEGHPNRGSLRLQPRQKAGQLLWLSRVTRIADKCQNGET